MCCEHKSILLNQAHATYLSIGCTPVLVDLAVGPQGDKFLTVDIDLGD